MKKCVFLDRDGIINQSPGPGYVERWEDFVLQPDIVPVLRRIQERGYVAVVATNQRGVSKGVMSREALETIHLNLVTMLSRDYQLDLLDVMVCTHGEGECECRKPKPGLLIEAARRHGIDLKQSWMVGDSEKDVEAGVNAGCRTVLVGGGGRETKAEHVVPDLKALETLLSRVLV